MLVLPRWDSLPYDPAGPSRDIMGRRMSVLRRLAGGLERPLLIATPEAVLQRVPPRELCKDAALRVVPGTELAEIEAFLRRTGYGLDMLVDEPGEAAVHGHVVDVFPAGALGPVRIEHEDGRVARIDSYDPASSARSMNCRKSCSTRPPSSCWRMRRSRLRATTAARRPLPGCRRIIRPRYAVRLPAGREGADRGSRGRTARGAVVRADPRGP